MHLDLFCWVKLHECTSTTVCHYWLTHHSEKSQTITASKSKLDASSTHEGDKKPHKGVTTDKKVVSTYMGNSQAMQKNIIL